MSVPSVEVRQFARVFVEEPGQLPPQAECYKSDRGYYYHLNLQSVEDDAASALVQKASQQFDVEVVGQVLEDGEVTKERRYVDDIDEVPDGYTPERGPQGGIYYETNPANNPASTRRLNPGNARSEVGYSNEPVLAVQFDDVDEGDRIAFEREDGDRDIGEVTEIDSEDHLVVVESGDGETTVAAAPLEGVESKSEGGGDGGGGDASMTSSTPGVHSARYSPDDDEDEEEDLEAVGEGGVGKAAEEAWVYYVGPQGGEGWQNMFNPQDIRYQKQRPGPAPEGGDGKGDFLNDGWAEPPDDFRELQPGQTLEVNYAGDYLEGTVALDSDGEKKISAEGKDELMPLSEGSGAIEVTAVEQDFDPHAEILEGETTNETSIDPDDAADWVKEYDINIGDTIPVSGGPLGDDGQKFEVISYNGKTGLPQVNGTILSQLTGVEGMAGEAITVEPQNIPGVPDDADAEPEPDMTPHLSNDFGLNFPEVPEGTPMKAETWAGDTLVMEFETVNDKPGLRADDGAWYGLEDDIENVEAVGGDYFDYITEEGNDDIYTEEETQPEDLLATAGVDLGDTVMYEDQTWEVTGTESMMANGDPSHITLENEDGVTLPAHPNTVEPVPEGSDTADDAVAEEVDVEPENVGWQAFTADYDMDEYDPDDVEQWGDLSDFGFTAGVHQDMEVGALPSWPGEGAKGLVFVNNYGPGAEKPEIGHRQMVTYSVASAIGGNVPKHVGHAEDDGQVVAEGVDGADIGSAPQSYIDNVDESDWFEQAAVQIICGNNDAHGANVKVTPDGDLAFHDIDHSAGDITDDFVGQKPYYENALDRTLGELHRSGKHVTGLDKQEHYDQMLDAAVEKAQELTNDEGNLSDSIQDALMDAKQYDFDLTQNVANNITALANGEVSL